MSRGNEKYSSTFYGDRKKQVKTPPKNEPQLRRTQPKSIDVKKKLIDNQNFHDIALHEKDERFRYLLKHGELKKVEKSGNMIFAELQQIPNVWVCYRRPVEREANMEKMNLDGMELTHVPLLEGEEKLKMLTFQHNKIPKIENLISLPYLLYLDFHDNLIKDIENLALPTLKVLMIAKNNIGKIKNISELVKL
jgi:leucine-rich repeat-containing protein 49